VGPTGLAANPTEYRSRLREQPDEQIDAWSAELMRDVAARRGVVKVVADFKRAARLDDRAFARVYSLGGGVPAVLGRDAEGRIMVPAITLFGLVPGLRSESPDARKLLIEYLVANFDEIVYV
jgi:hypothetical protein